MSAPLIAPFPWFGGKSSVADEVWRRFGSVANFVEPFFGSGACLLARPNVAGFETVNDFDGLLTNAWRALQIDPMAVAHHANWPVSECDLHARHYWLLGQRESITARLMGDPDYFDAKAAGWWLWGISSWIGSGWCSGDGPWYVSEQGELVDDRQLPRMSAAQGINRQLPRMSAAQGINRKLPHLSEGKGINRKLPHLSEGKGINRKLEDYFQTLSDRLRGVRVACGDFERVLGPSVTTGIGTTAVFLDPPYDTDSADCHDAYSTGVAGTAERARQWAVANGSNPSFRIALCGYMGEHDEDMIGAGFTAFQWKARGGYGNQGSGRGRENAKREVIWFSKYCLDQQQAGLF
jgi:DNA adenine methylase